MYSHGSGCEDLFALQGDKKNFLFLLHWNGWSDFEIISEMGKLLLGKTYSGERFRAILALLCIIVIIIFLEMGVS